MAGPSEATNGSVSIHHEADGDSSGEPLVLVMGLGGQLTGWHPEFKAALLAHGFFVVTFDNRDAGRSTWLDGAGTPDLRAVLGGETAAPYLLSDMATDTAAVLDAIGLASAHVVGASMGGMIAQSLAIEHPGRVRSLTSIMSTTGSRTVGQPHPGIIDIFLAPPPADRAGRIAQAVRGTRAISSPGYPFDEARAEARAGEDHDRGYHPSGTARQALAILASGDRTSALGGVRVPTLVVHGDADPLVDVSGGRATAAAVPGATLLVLPGMGHDLPPALHATIADAIATVAGVGP